MKLKGIWQSASVQVQIMYLLMMILISFVVFSVIGMLGTVLGGMPNMSDLSEGNTMSVLKWMQGCTAIGLFVVPPLLFAYATQHALGWKKISRQQGMLAVAVMLLAIPSINALAVWNEGLHLPEFLAALEQWMRIAEAQAMRMTEAFLVMESPVDLVVNLLLVAAIPAIGEELLFRGVLQKLFLKWNGKVHLSVWLTAFLFSAMHFQFLGFVPRFLLGGLLGYLLVWSGSVWLPILAHFTNNAVAVLITYFVGMKQINPEIETLGGEGGSAVLISTFGCLLLLYFIKEISTNKT